MTTGRLMWVKRPTNAYADPKDFIRGGFVKPSPARLRPRQVCMVLFTIEARQWHPSMALVLSGDVLGWIDADTMEQL